MKENVINHYTNYDEDGRLTRDNVHKLEWLTTLKYFDKLIPNNSYILDTCAGTGNYSFYLAAQGHRVIANDLVPHHVKLIQEKQLLNSLLEDVTQGDVCNLEKYSDETFDVVLCMGAFYHLDLELRSRAMQECLRVLKKEGLLIIAYINNIAVTMRYIGSNLENMDQILKAYHQKTIDNIFLCMSPLEIEEIAITNDTTILKHLGTNGAFYFLSDKINTATEENFQKYLDLHLQTCEDPSIIGYSLHGLIFLRKN